MKYLLLISLLLLTACGAGKVTNDQFIKATEKCANNDGLDYIWRSPNLHPDTIVCNNGAEFEVGE